MKEKTKSTAEILLPHVQYHLNRVAKAVLGKSSSDYTMTVFDANERLCDDLIQAYESLRREIRWLWWIVIVLFIISIVLYSKLKLM